jgi:hypothetical protein
VAASLLLSLLLLLAMVVMEAKAVRLSMGPKLEK